MESTVIGLFEDVEAAQRAVEDLTLAGFTHDDIRILDREKVLAAPGVMDDFRASGVPEEDTGLYNEGIHRGGLLIAVTVPEDRAEEARDLIERHHPANIAERADAYRLHTGEAEQSDTASLSPGVQQHYIPRAPAGSAEPTSYTQNYAGGDNIIGMSSPTRMNGTSDKIGTTGDAAAGGMMDHFTSPGSRIPVSSEQADPDVIAIRNSPVSARSNGNGNGRHETPGGNGAAGGRPTTDAMTGRTETAGERIIREGMEAHRARVGGPVDAGENAYRNGHHARVYGPQRH
jgi:hypothetical protein